MLPKEFYQGDENQPRQHPACKYGPCDAGANDIADAQILRRDVGGECPPGIPGRLISRPWPPAEQGFVEELVSHAEAEPGEHPAGKAPTSLARHQDVRAGLALGVLKLP